MVQNGARTSLVTGAVEGEVGDVDVAEDRQEESVMDADAVGDDALQFRDDSAGYSGSSRMVMVAGETIKPAPFANPAKD